MGTGVDAILMASGFSARFGDEDKLLANFNGQPLAMATLRLVCGTNFFDNIFFIYAEDTVGALAFNLPVIPLRNARPHLGSRESVRVGVNASKADYYMFFPCDQPLLDRHTVQTIWASRQPGRIVVPSHGGVAGKPVLFSAHYRRELLGLLEGEQARVIEQRNRDAVIAVPIVDALVLADVDTEEDLRRLEQRRRA